MRKGHCSSEISECAIASISIASTAIRFLRVDILRSTIESSSWTEVEGSGGSGTVHDQ
jgi:hypothetical protein